MKGQIPFFDIGVVAIALAVFVIISIFLLENLHLYYTTILINIIYDTNEAHRLLVSLLSLNYNSQSVYEMIPIYEYSIQTYDFHAFLNASLYRYFETIPKCYKLTFGSKVIVEFKSEGYSQECSNTRFNAALPIFLPYNKGRLVEYLYLNYER